MKHLTSIVTLYFWLLLIPNNLNGAYGSGGVDIEHWVGLQPRDLWEEYVSTGDFTNDSWKLKVLDKDRKKLIGFIVAKFKSSTRELKFRYQSIENSEKQFTIIPHLLPNRVDIRAYLTILDRSEDRRSVKVKFLDHLGEVWITPGEGYEGWLTSESLRRGNRLIVNNSNSINVEYVNPNSLIVRNMQEADWNCSARVGEEVAFKSFTTRMIPRKDWIDGNGRSIFTFANSGC